MHIKYGPMCDTLDMCGMKPSCFEVFEFCKLIYFHKTTIERWYMHYSLYMKQLWQLVNQILQSVMITGKI